MLKDYNNNPRQEEEPNPVILCSWDIESMFPNVDNDLGLGACREILDRRHNQEPSTNSIVEAIRLTLEENIAEFNDKVVKQCSGTAMGPHHSCSYTDIAIDKAIDRRVNSAEYPWQKFINLWGRFRDDICCIWTGTEEELLQFNTWLNNLEPKLKFTVESSKETVVFLDLRLTVKGTHIETSMYSKPSDTHAYLMPSSCHPTHICKNIPQGVMKRVRRNCSEESVRKETYIEYKQYLLLRNYDKELIEEAIQLAEATPRERLFGLDLDTNNPRKPRKFPAIIKFNPRLPPLSKFIHENLHILDLTPETKKLFNKDTVFVSYKTEQNILSMITKNRFKRESSIDNEQAEISQPDNLNSTSRNG